MKVIATICVFLFFSISSTIYSQESILKLNNAYIYKIDAKWGEFQVKGGFTHSTSTGSFNKNIPSGKHSIEFAFKGNNNPCYKIVFDFIPDESYEIIQRKKIPKLINTKTQHEVKDYIIENITHELPRQGGNILTYEKSNKQVDASYLINNGSSFKAMFIVHTIDDKWGPYSFNGKKRYNNKWNGEFIAEISPGVHSIEFSIISSNPLFLKYSEAIDMIKHDFKPGVFYKLDIEVHKSNYTFKIVEVIK